MQLSNSSYDKWKYTAQIILPGLGTLYFALSQIWGSDVFPAPAEVVGSITAVDAFLGLLLGLSNRNYKNDTDGYLDSEGVDPDTGHPDLKLVITKMPQDLLDKDVVRLKVGTPPRVD